MAGKRVRELCELSIAVGTKIGQGLVSCLPFRQNFASDWGKKVHFSTKNARPGFVVLVLPSLCPFFPSKWLKRKAENEASALKL